MRKREREEKTNNTEKVHRTNNGGSEVEEKEKEQAFSEHTQEAFFAHHNASAPSRASVVASFASVSSGDERSSPSRAVREADERSRLFMTRRLRWDSWGSSSPHVTPASNTRK